MEYKETFDIVKSPELIALFNCPYCNQPYFNHSDLIEHLSICSVRHKSIYKPTKLPTLIKQKKHSMIT